MALFTLWFGTAMVLLGFIEFGTSGLRSPLALAPTVLGLPLALFGFLNIPKARMAQSALTICAALALAGLVVSLGGFADVRAMYNEEKVANPIFAVARSVVGTLFLAYVVAAGIALAGRRKTARG